MTKTEKVLIVSFSFYILFYILHGNIDQTLLHLLHDLLKFDIAWFECCVITTEYRTSGHWIQCNDYFIIHWSIYSFRSFRSMFVYNTHVHLAGAVQKSDIQKKMFWADACVHLHDEKSYPANTMSFWRHHVDLKTFCGILKTIHREEHHRNLCKGENGDVRQRHGA